MMGWRALRDDWDIKVIYTPIFILAVLSWVLGFFVIRVWTDWGIPAVCVWMALEMEKYLKTVMASSSWKRVGLTLAVACVVYISITSNHNSRWTENLSVQYLSADKPEHKKLLPGKGGIIYSSHMPVFYQTFYANPHGDWRYILGFEQSMMPPEDFAIFRKIQLTNHSAQAFGLWVQKMRPEDRMILQMVSKPAVKGLEWNNTVPGTWVGRLPEKQKDS
jgi:hypothetical protein